MLSFFAFSLVNLKKFFYFWALFLTALSVYVEKLFLFL